MILHKAFGKCEICQKSYKTCGCSSEEDARDFLYLDHAIEYVGKADVHCFEGEITFKRVDSEKRGER